MSANYEKYRRQIEELYDQTKDEVWTMPLATLVLLLSAVLAMTLLVNVVFHSFGSWPLAVLVYAAEIGALGFMLYNYRQKVARRMREKIDALAPANPGLSEAYDEWRGPQRR